MGLDTTHDCWHGPYSQFMRWREFLNFCVMHEREKDSPVCAEIRRMGITREAIMKAWETGQYDDQSVPINVLMNHSDSDGSIPAEVCGPLADALNGLIERYMPARGIYDEMKPATERFVAGLRRAFEAGQDVEFH